MARRSRALAAGLRDRGVGRGDVVGLLSYNCPEFLETDLRRQLPRCRRHADQLAARRARGALHPRALPGPGAGVRRGARRPGQRGHRGPRAGAGPGLRLRPPPRTDGRRSRTSTATATAWSRAAVAADDIHRLMYTSGTTGRPKGVMITHANLAWKNLAHIVEFGFTDADLGLACGPLYHVGALDLTTTSLIAAGATVIIHRSFDAAAVVDELERSRVSTVWLAPAMVNAIMALPDVERARPVVGAADHQRWREDAHPPHRADPAHVPLGLVRRRLRAHRDGVGRHLPRPGQHHHQARQRRTPVPLPRARHLGRAGRVGAARATRRDRPAGPEGVPGLLAGPGGDRRRRSPAAGSTPGTSASATRTATSSSSTA